MLVTLCQKAVKTKEQFLREVRPNANPVYICGLLYSLASRASQRNGKKGASTTMTWRAFKEQHEARTFVHAKQFDMGEIEIWITLNFVPRFLRLVLKQTWN